ncbi:6898_t:CDS:1 [Cetraspora pellucida]|uniref:6898_t:CDS:1 n=1 Tax=Cetraspora pellucida TaxID=1433469 RepID=A0A9N8VM02_9GLOM|nr:6898_t:CDS:1 [Cetraspora pellucida]
MKFLKNLVILLLVINAVACTCSKAKSVPSSQVSVLRNQVLIFVDDFSLPQLYTWDFKKGRYMRVLNKNSKMCKSYPGGLYLQSFPKGSAKAIYQPVHKPKGANIKRPRS